MRTLSHAFHHCLKRMDIIAVTCLVLSGCASKGVASPTANQPPEATVGEAASISTNTPATSATSTVTRVPRLTPGPTWTPRPKQPTAAPTPTNGPATSYPAPAVPLSPTGPWLLFTGDGYLWAINQNGTGLTRLTSGTIRAFAVRPISTVQTGIEIAYSTGSAIKMLSLPGGAERTIVYGSAWDLRWSSNGGKLAFSGYLDDYDTDDNLFIYDFATGESTRISSNNDVDDFIWAWSTDQRYITFAGYAWSPMSSRAWAVGMWSARTDASGVTLLTDGIQPAIEMRPLGWLNSTELIILSRDWNSNAEVRIVNIETGKYTTVAKEPLFDVTYSPEHNIFLMTQWPSAPPNTLLIFYQDGERREVTGYGIKWVVWVNAHDMFLGQTPDGKSYLISPDGALAEIPSPEWNLKRSHPVIVSPDGQWWAWHHYHSIEYDADISASELWVGPAMSQPSILLSFDSRNNQDYSSDDPVVHSGNVIWSPDSQHLFWTTSQGTFIAGAPDFEPTLIVAMDATFWNALWVQ